MNKIIFLLFLNVLLFSSTFCAAELKSSLADEYVVVASKRVMADPEWEKVARALEKKHQAVLIQYEISPMEILKGLQKLSPRYVAFVEKPEYIGPDYVIEINRLSCRMDEDVYSDFFWGIITGYDAANALEMVENASRPLEVRNVFSTSAFRDTATVSSFDRYAWMDEYYGGMWGQKKADGGITWKGLQPSGNSRVDSASGMTVSQMVAADFFDCFFRLYGETEPDWVLTGAYSGRPRWNMNVFDKTDFQPVSEATAFQFPLPFGTIAQVKAKDGKICADYPDGTRSLPETKRPKVCIAAGDNFGGNIANTRESLPIAWMNGGHAAALIGYVTPNWYGVGGYGIVKHWVASAGRYSLPEAAFLNKQDIIARLYGWNPRLAEIDFPYDRVEQSVDVISEATGIALPTREQIGCLYDRDAVAYYGDPKWDVRLKGNEENRGFTITTEIGKKSCTITVKTLPGFHLNNLMGNDYKPECTDNLPFGYIFPRRLPNVRLAAGQTWKAKMDENFILVYVPEFEANKEYKIVLEFDENTKKR